MMFDGPRALTLFTTRIVFIRDKTTSRMEAVEQGFYFLIVSASRRFGRGHDDDGVVE
jgi:hypothetical protein